MIPSKVKVEAVIKIKDANRDCSEDEIEEWFESIIKIALERNFVARKGASTNTIESINATIIE